MNLQGWTLNFETLAIRASDPQNVLARTSFHSPKTLRPPPPPPIPRLSRLKFLLWNRLRFVPIAAIDESIGV